MSHILIVCARRYNGHELWVALGVLQKRGHTFDLASTDYVIRDEITMRPNRIKLTVNDITVEDIPRYQGLMIVSGNMKDTEAYWDSKHLLRLIRTANEAGLAVAAICCSVPTIREIAEGKKVSFFPLLRSRERLSRAGAILQTVAMTRDANLVTAEHQMASQVWAEEFCNLLEGKIQTIFFHDTGFTPKGRERKPIPAVERLKNLRNGNKNE